MSGEQVAVTNRGGEGSAAAALKLGYRPALDGIRACAVLGVLAYHSGTQLEGGWIGVDIFFVLSGFLITTLLFQEWSATGGVALADFYERRVRRLFPALLLTVAAVGVIYGIDPALNGGLGFGTAALTVIFYVGNWVAAFASNPIQVLSLLDHTWSLAIEEQFYILWPPLLVLCLRRQWKPRHLFIVAIVLACASSILRAVLWKTHTGGHIYFRSDARADGLLLGCTLAAAWASLPSRELVRRYVRSPLVAIFAAAALLFFALTLGPNDRFVYVGGLSAIAACAAVLIAHVVTAERSWVTTGLALPPLVWIGARSYGIYLFHIPIFSVIATTELAKKPARLVIPLQIALTMLVAAASYKWIESYFLRRKRVPGAPPHVQRPEAERAAPAG